MQWDQIIKEALTQVQGLKYDSPYQEAIKTTDSEVSRLQELLKGVEIPTDTQTIKNFQARIQAKALHSEIMREINSISRDHNELIAKEKAHFDIFKERLVKVYQSVKTLPSVDYGAPYGVIALDKETYSTLLFEANEGQIREYFEILQSREEIEIAGSTQKIKSKFDTYRPTVKTFMEAYNVSKESIVEFVAVVDHIKEREDRARRESIERTLMKQTPNYQAYSRPNTQKEQQTKILPDGSIDLGTLTTQGTVRLDSNSEMIDGVEISDVI